MARSSSPGNPGPGKAPRRPEPGAFHPLRRISRLLPEGMPLPVLRGPARGRLWLAGAAPGPSRGLSVVWNRSEPEQLAAADELSRAASCCFDIGAHAGLYSLVFARNAPSVCAFEPLPRNLAWLRRTLRWNRAANVAVFPWAVSSASGTFAFREGEHNSMGRLDSEGELPVRAVTLREFLAEHGFRPDVLKIDVEGAETEVLRGGLDYLRERRPALLLSVHGARRRTECLELARYLGYARVRPLNARDPDQADEFRIEV